jgi:hypothetical protein
LQNLDAHFAVRRRGESNGNKKEEKSKKEMEEERRRKVMKEKEKVVIEEKEIIEMKMKMEKTRNRIVVFHVRSTAVLFKTPSYRRTGHLAEDRNQKGPLARHTRACPCESSIIIHTAPSRFASNAALKYVSCYFDSAFRI